MTRTVFVALAFGAVAVAVTGPASAQEAVRVDQASPDSQGPMTLERVHDSWAIAPDFKMTRLDGASRALTGGYVGRIFDDTLLIGGAGYWLPDNSINRKLAYGGAVVEWREHPGDGPIGFAIKGLVGFGQSTMTSTVNLVDNRYGPFLDRDRSPSAQATTAIIRFDQGFFVAEPQAELLIGLARNVRLNCGVGYRAVGAANGVENRLRGVSGGIGLEFGGASWGSVRARP
jgi:hypothetical protein